MKGKMKLKQNSFLLLVTILLFFIMYGIGCVLFNAQGFSKTQNFLNLFISNAGLIVIGIGMTVVMITGGIDISVGSFVAMGCMMLAWMMEKGGIGAVPAVIIVLVTGIVFGLVQGFLVALISTPNKVPNTFPTPPVRRVPPITEEAMASISKPFACSTKPPSVFKQNKILPTPQRKPSNT